MQKIIIFASGEGTNALNLYQYLTQKTSIRVAALITNNRKAGVVVKFRALPVAIVFTTQDELHSGVLLRRLESYAPSLLVLAGFLLKIPSAMVSKFQKKIINIHPSLLPKYGGKGMYGNKIHQKILDNGDKITGITIHWVNEHYDEGEIIFQRSMVVEPTDTLTNISEKIHALEYAYFPVVVARLLAAQVDKG